MSYNGWTNYETWNVFLWISNDEGLYSMAREYPDYDSFVAALKELSDGAIAYETPDNVSWTDSALDKEEIATHWAEL